METFSALLTAQMPVTLLCFLWTIDETLNNRDAVDLRCHRAHHGATVMSVIQQKYTDIVETMSTPSRMNGLLFQDTV